MGSGLTSMWMGLSMTSFDIGDILCVVIVVVCIITVNIFFMVSLLLED